MACFFPSTNQLLSRFYWLYMYVLYIYIYIYVLGNYNGKFGYLLLISGDGIKISSIKPIYYCLLMITHVK
jgi:hypothetical protein